MAIPVPKPRLFALAAACMLLMLVPALPASANSTTGGVFAGTTLVSAPAGAYAGRKSLLRGTTPLTGTVLVQARIGDGLWATIGRADPVGGNFTLTWKPTTSGRYELRTIPLSASTSAVGESAAAGLGSISVYRLQRTTWYGPGFFGRRTACGGKLTRRTLGVAHRTLPCGTRVEFFKAGKSVIVPVIDRGPFVRGVAWDLTYAAARRIKMLGSERIGALSLR